MNGIDRELILRLVQVMVGMRHIKCVRGHFLLDDIPRATAQTQSLSLTHRMKPVSSMAGELLVCLQFDDVADFFAQVKANKLWILDLSEKTNSLAIFPVLV